MPVFSVMISSTQVDLQAEIQAVKKACEVAGLHPIHMDSEPVAHRPDANAISESLAWVEKCDIYLCIIGRLYRYIPDDATQNPERYSITEMEYRYALQLGKPMIAFLVDDAADVPAWLVKLMLTETSEQRMKLEAFREFAKIRHVGLFKSAEQLKDTAIASLNAAKQALEKVAQGRRAEQSNTPAGTTDTRMIPLPPALPEPYLVPRYQLTRRFIGREDELSRLDGWAQQSELPVMVVEAIGGEGKSALTWEWVQKRAPQTLKKRGMIWWSFYERGTNMEEFLRYSLAYVKGVTPESLLNRSYGQLSYELFNILDREDFLIVMDGFERVLIAYHRYDKAHLRDEQVSDSPSADEALRNYCDCTDPRDEEFIRALVNLHASKVLITSRLFPTALEGDYGVAHLNGVAHIKLTGLNRDDARQLLLASGVNAEYAAPNLVNEFMQSIGSHALLINIAGKMIADYRLARGNFNRWYEDKGIRINFAEMAKHDRRNHILYYAFQELSADAAALLSHIAAFSAPVDYKTISIFNPYLPPRPPAPELPSFLQERPSPFGTPKQAFLQDKLARTFKPEERAQLEDALQQQRAEDERQSQLMRDNQASIRQRNRRIKDEREEILQAFERRYEQSPEYLSAVSQFQDVLTELEERNLLSWDRDKDVYDIHPVVRGFAHAQMSPERRRQAHEKILDHFGTTADTAPEMLSELDQISNLDTLIEYYNALIYIGELNAAATHFRSRLHDKLSRQGKSHQIIELLKPLFNDEISQRPELDENNADVITTYMARALQAVGDVKRALKLFSLSLQPEASTMNAWGRAIAVIDYGFNMQEFNQLAQADRAYQLAALLTPPDNYAWVHYDNLLFYILVGQWEKAEAEYQAALQVSLPETQPQDWQARMALLRARMLVKQGKEAQSALDEARYLLEQTEQRARLGTLDEEQALYCLDQGDLDGAYQAIQRAITIANEMGEVSVIRDAILARILLAMDRRQAAENRLQRALDLRTLSDGKKADLYMHAAYVYWQLGKRDLAQKWALEGYHFAWADGTPYVRWYPLVQLQALMRELGIAEPQYAVWDASQSEAIPYEKELRDLYLQDGRLIEQSSSKAKSQAPFIITKGTWFQVGTIATFGIDDLSLLEGMASKIASLSDLPTPIVISRMGEEVPQPEELVIAEQKRRFDEIQLSFAERKVVEKCFIICYVESLNEAGEKVYAYINIRFDRLKALFDRLEKGRAFDLNKQATFVMGGTGDVDLENREKMRRDYLFGEYVTNVRIFPPLKEVTNGTASSPASPSTSNKPLPKAQKLVEVRRFERIQIGTVAVFGIDDEMFVRGIANKLTRLSDTPTPVVFSRMGEDVPDFDPSTAPHVGEQLAWSQLLFSLVEQRALDKVFVILLVQSRNSAGESVFAYVNARGDRLATLLEQGAQDKAFNLSNYATLVLDGQGEPDSAAREKLARDYLFGETHLNLRLFPPLSDVT